MTSLPRSPLAEAGVDPAGIAAFIDTMEAAPDIQLHSLMVLRHGAVVAEGWWAPYTADRVHLLYSLSKSFTATAAAFAAAEGLLDLDDTVVSHFGEFDADVVDGRSRSIRLRHVAAMASGHLRETVEQAVRNDPAEPVRGFLLIPPERDPGTVFAYNQPCTYALAAVIQRRAGATLTDYLRPRLFDPLGIAEVAWQSDHLGREVGFTGLHARTEDVAKLGLLYLQRGVWEGRQLISAGWVAEATRSQVANPDEPNPDWRQGYGFQFWMSRHGYRGDGAYGQFCLVLPEQDAVIAVTAETPDMQAVLDAVWAHLLPAFGDAPRPTSATDAELTTRLQNLSLPVVDAGSEPVGAAEEWTAAPFVVWNPPEAAGVSVSAVAVERAGMTWRIRLDEESDSLSFEVGTNSWAVTEAVTGGGVTVPVAASGGWSDQSTLQLSLVFLETPHSMNVTCRLQDRVAQVTWRTVPLAGTRLADMAAPGALRL